MDNSKDTAPVNGPEPVGYALTLQTDIGNGRTLVIVGNMPRGATRADFDKELDKLCGAVERKQDEATIPALQDAVDKDLAERESHLKNLAIIEEEFSKKDQPVQKERALQVHENAVAALTQRIESRQKLIASLTAKLEKPLEV